MSDPAAGSEGSLPPDWRAPADARELQAELRALRREQAWAGRRHSQRPESRPWWQRYRQPGAVTALLLIGVAATAVALMVGAPVGLPTQSAARPLASPSASPGAVGALLPAMALRVGQQPRPARSLRPAVLAVLPVPCRCTAVLTALAGEAGQYALPLILITPAGNAEVPSLLAAARATRSYPAVDPGTALARVYEARGLTVLLVRADGLVTAVERQVGTGRSFGTVLATLGA